MKVVSLILQIFLYLEEFPSNTTSYWLTCIQFIQSKVVLLSNVQNLGEKDKECS